MDPDPSFHTDFKNVHMTLVKSAPKKSFSQKTILTFENCNFFLLFAVRNDFEALVDPKKSQCQGRPLIMGLVMDNEPLISCFKLGGRTYRMTFPHRRCGEGETRGYMGLRFTIPGSC
jgi:hypothetical protein